MTEYFLCILSFIFRIGVFWLCVSVHHLYAWCLQRPETGIGFFVKFSDSCEVPCGWWGSALGPLWEHLVIFTPELSSVLSSDCFYWFWTCEPLMCRIWSLQLPWSLFFGFRGIPKWSRVVLPCAAASRLWGLKMGLLQSMDCLGAHRMEPDATAIFVCRNLDIRKLCKIFLKNNLCGAL